MDEWNRDPPIGWALAEAVCCAGETACSCGDIRVHGVGEPARHRPGGLVRSSLMAISRQRASDAAGAGRTAARLGAADRERPGLRFALRALGPRLVQVDLHRAHLETGPGRGLAWG